MRKCFVLFIVVSSLLAALSPPSAQAVMLVAPISRAPIGGRFQLWADESRIPTIGDVLTFSTDASRWPECPLACSVKANRRAKLGYETFVNPGADDWSFYFELGHQFDWHYLRPANRRWLIRHWHPFWPEIRRPARGVPWFDTSRALLKGGEDGYEAIFAGIYADCAYGTSDANLPFRLDAEPRGVHIPTIRPDTNSCLYLDRIAAKRGADMASSALARWNRGRLARHHGA